jgi:hypothetical protein
MRPQDKVPIKAEIGIGLAVVAWKAGAEKAVLQSIDFRAVNCLSSLPEDVI